MIIIKILKKFHSNIWFQLLFYLLVLPTFLFIIDRLLYEISFVCHGFFVLFFFAFYFYLLWNIVVFFVWFFMFLLFPCFGILQKIFIYTVGFITFYFVALFSDLWYFFIYWSFIFYAKIYLLFVLFSGDIHKLRKYFKLVDSFTQKHLFIISRQEAFRRLSLKDKLFLLFK